MSEVKDLLRIIQLGVRVQFMLVLDAHKTAVGEAIERM